MRRYRDFETSPVQTLNDSFIVASFFGVPQNDTASFFSPLRPCSESTSSQPRVVSTAPVHQTPSHDSIFMILQHFFVQQRADACGVVPQKHVGYVFRGHQRRMKHPTDFRHCRFQQHQLPHERATHLQIHFGRPKTNRPGPTVVT